MEVLLNLIFLFFLSWSSVPDNKCHKQKWHVLFYTRIKLVARVLACARAIAQIKRRRLLSVVVVTHQNIIFNSITVHIGIIYQKWVPWIKSKRSSRPEVFCKKSVLENFAKFT